MSAEFDLGKRLSLPRAEVELFSTDNDGNFRVCGISLLEIRKILSLSQEEIARKIGFSGNTWARWERRELLIGHQKTLALGLVGLTSLMDPTRQLFDWKTISEAVRRS